MSLWKIAWRSIQQRSLASALTALSMSLGVGLVVAVLVIHGVIDQSFRRGAQGYDLIVGAARGSRLELVLSTIFHLGRPSATMPYKTYYRLVAGQYGADIQVAVPVCLGDTFKGFRVIATQRNMFDVLKDEQGNQYGFAEGANFDETDEYGAVLGSTAARKTGLKVGDKFKTAHGDGSGHGKNNADFEVKGILEPTGTPNDRGIFINLEGFYKLHATEGGHEAGEKSKETAEKPPEAAGKPAADSGGEKGHAAEAQDHDHFDMENRDVTAVLVVLNENMPMTRRVALSKVLNRDQEMGLQAVSPSEEVTRLFEGIVGNVQKVLLVLAVLIVIVAGIGILVSMYNSMSDRKREIAIMRALGARRSTVMLTVLCESILLALGGGAIGVLLGHGLTGALGPLIAENTGVTVSPFQFQTAELVLIPGLILLATAVGYLPAVVAYRTDVAESLISSP
jgi:putative ABC transport system permease protein